MSLLVHIKIDHKGNVTVENSVARGNSHQNLTFLTELLVISFFNIMLKLYIEYTWSLCIILIFVLFGNRLALNLLPCPQLPLSWDSSCVLAHSSLPTITTGGVHIPSVALL